MYTSTNYTKISVNEHLESFGQTSDRLLAIDDKADVATNIYILFSLLDNCHGERDIKELFNFLFTLLPHFTSDNFENLKLRAISLLMRSKHHYDLQLSLAIHLARYYYSKGHHVQAMHCIAKAHQMAKLDDHLEKLKDTLYEQLLEPLEIPLKVAFPDAFSGRYEKRLHELRWGFQIPVNDVRMFQKDRKEDFSHLFQGLLSDIFSIIGMPPCGYDFRAMGSMGREEALPFSDLEFFILFEDCHDLEVNASNRSYFKTLQHLLAQQMALFGETKFDDFVFDCLKDPMPIGLHLDMAKGEGTNFENDALEIPSIAAKQARWMGLTNTFGNMVLKSSSIAQSSNVLFEEYKNGLEKTLPEVDRKQLALSFIKVRCEDAKVCWRKRFDNKTPYVDIKRQFFELLHLLLGDMGLYFGLEETNTLDIIAALEEKGVFLPTSAMLLKLSVEQLYCLRLRLHNHKSKKCDVASCDPEKFGPETVILTFSEVKTLARCYWFIFFPLYRRLERLKHNVTLEDTLYRVDLFSDTLSTSDKILPMEFLVELMVAHLCAVKTDIETHQQLYKALTRHNDEKLRRKYCDIVAKKAPEAFSSLISIPNECGDRLSYNYRQERLEKAINALTTSEPKGSFIVRVTAPDFASPRYLKPKVVNSLMDGVHLKNQYTSSHRVCSLSSENFNLHFKEMPYNPLMEYAIHSLVSRMVGLYTPTVELVRFDIILDKEFFSYPVLISETLPGGNLKEKWDQAIPNESSSWLALSSILTRPGDGKLDNYLLDDAKNMYSVDNDASFCEPVMKEALFFSKVNFCAAPFTLFPLDTLLDKNVLQAFARLDPYSILSSWLDEIVAKEKQYMSLFPFVKERKAFYGSDPNLSFTPRLLMQQGALSTLYLQWIRLQNYITQAIERNQGVSYGDLLHELISLRNSSIGTHVFKAYSKAKGDNPDNKLASALGRSKLHTLTSMQSRIAALGDIPTHEDIEACTKYSLEMAREELSIVMQKNYFKHATIKDQKGELVFEINFYRLKGQFERQKIVLQALTGALNKEQFNVKALTIAHCEVIAEELMDSFLHEDITSLKFNYCTNIDYDMLCLLEKKCPKLQHLTIIGSRNLKGFHFSPTLRLNYLTSLEITHCPLFTHLKLEALSLKTLKLKENPTLKNIDLHSIDANIDAPLSLNVNHKTIGFGRKDWEKYLGYGIANQDIYHQMDKKLYFRWDKSMGGDWVGNQYDASEYTWNEPPLPPSLVEILASPCPFWRDKKVLETHSLLLIPPNVSLEKLKTALSIGINRKSEGQHLLQNLEMKAPERIQRTFIDSVCRSSNKEARWALICHTPPPDPFASEQIHKRYVERFEKLIQYEEFTHLYRLWPLKTTASKQARHNYEGNSLDGLLESSSLELTALLLFNYFKFKRKIETGNLEDRFLTQMDALPEGKGKYFHKKITWSSKENTSQLILKIKAIRLK